MLTTEEKTNLTEGFKAAGDRITGLEEDTKNTVQELKAQTEVIARQLKMYSKAVLNAQAETVQGNRRFWPTDEHAKQFGELFLKAASQKALGEGTNVGGGYLVPTELMSIIIERLGQFGKYRRNTTIVTMGSDRLVVPKVDADLTVYAPGEGKEITESDMEFGQVGLTAKKWACLTKVSSELEEDSVIALGEILGLSIARSLAKKEDEVGFMGDGTETYFGMTGIIGSLRGVDATIGSIKGLIVAAGNAYSEITLANFREVVGILPEDCDETAKWFMSKKFYYNVVYPLAETAGVANIFEILSDRKSKYLLGYEVEFVHAMPSVEANSQICVILGDLQLGSFLGERRQLSIARSTDVYFANDQIGFRGTERIDICAFGVGDTTEAGPIVGLITAAA